MQNKEIVETVGADVNTVEKWRRRFTERRLDRLYDKPRAGTPRRIGGAEVCEVVHRTPEGTPSDGAHWNSRATFRPISMSIW